jgi:hypothetical protein
MAFGQQPVTLEKSGEIFIKMKHMESGTDSETPRFQAINNGFRGF